MDEYAKGAALFSEALQNGWIKLLETRNSFMLRGGAKNAVIFQNLTGKNKDPQVQIVGAWVIGLVVTPRNGAALDMAIQLGWDKEEWTVKTTVWADTDDDQEVIREFPKKRANTFEELLACLEVALQEIASCEDLLT